MFVSSLVYADINKAYNGRKLNITLLKQVCFVVGTISKS